MARLGMGFGRRRGLRAPAPVPTAPPGFALNGSVNPKLKAMLARVAAGTARGRIVMKGDSTTQGAGAGGSGSIGTQVTNARPGRPSAVLAAQLSALGYPALDNGFVGDNGVGASATLPAYDPRIAYPGAAWVAAGGQGFPGGAYLNGNNAGPLQFTPATAVDTFEVVAYSVGGTHTVTIDGAAPAALTASNGLVSGNAVTPPSGDGITRIVATAATGGLHSVRVAPAGSALLRSIIAYDGGVRAIDILNHASGGAKAGDQAAVGNDRLNNDALGHDAPDLTIINLGLNDAAQGTPAAAYTASLRAIIIKARLSGDVLLVSPHPASPSFTATANQTGLRNAAAALAAGEGVAFMDLFAYFGGWPAVSARTADGLVHPRAEMYAEIGEVYRRCIQAMAT